MAISKASVVALASASNAVGAVTTGPWINNASSYGTTVAGTYVNGSTAPTAGVRQRVQICTDGAGANLSDFNPGGETAPTTASTTGYFQPVLLPPEIPWFRVVYDSNTGSAVTVAAVAYQLTGV